MQRLFASTIAVLIGLASSSAAASSISRSALVRPIRKQLPRFRACYAQARKRSPTQGGGRITVRFDVGRGGYVTRARIMRNDIHDAQLTSCVLRTFMRVRYPKDFPNPISVVYPMHFK